MGKLKNKKLPYHTRLKSNFNRLLYIIFFITQIHTVCLVSISGEASIVRPSKKKIWEKKIEKKKCWKMNCKTKIFIIKIHSYIDKCHTIFFLLAPFDKTGRKTGKTSFRIRIMSRIKISL